MLVQPRSERTRSCRESPSIAFTSSTATSSPTASSPRVSESFSNAAWIGAGSTQQHVSPAVTPPPIPATLAVMMRKWSMSCCLSLSVSAAAAFLARFASICFAIRARRSGPDSPGGPSIRTSASASGSAEGASAV